MIGNENTALRVSVFDPTGNVTALVEGAVGPGEQSGLAARIMERFPGLEQVGFVRLPTEEDGPIALRMAGGEFCGNASMSAAALFLLRRGGEADEEKTMRLRVSGVSREVEVRLRKEAAESFRAAVTMPPALAVEELCSAYGPLSVVRMEGIAHALVTPEDALFPLLRERARAEKAAKELCAALGAEAFGLMFLEGEAPRLRLTPLVYVPGSGTICWERSCASGSAAAGICLAGKSGAPVSLEFSEPGGVLGVESDGLRGETRLYGRTRLVLEEEL